MAIELTLNGQRVSFAGDVSMPLLWYLRDHAKLTGTKFGCGIGSLCRAGFVGTLARGTPRANQMLQSVACTTAVDCHSFTLKVVQA
jgi:isoquinoline 1-oxidoreductase subunit alpha